MCAIELEARNACSCVMSASNFTKWRIAFYFILLHLAGSSSEFYFVLPRFSALFRVSLRFSAFFRHSYRVFTIFYRVNFLRFSAFFRVFPHFSGLLCFSAFFRYSYRVFTIFYRANCLRSARKDRFPIRFSPFLQQ